MLKPLTRSYYLMIGLVLLFASSSAFAARELRDAKAHASRRGGRAHGSSKGAHGTGAGGRREEARERRSATVKTLLGDAVVETQEGVLQAGQAEAFRLRGATSATATDAHLYIGAGNGATSVLVGVYNGHYKPQALLSSGTATASKPGAWTTVPIKPLEVVKNKVYWLAILGEGGALHYRESPDRSCSSVTTTGKSMRTLPSWWSKRPHRRTGLCPASAYLSTSSGKSTSKPGGEKHEEESGHSESAPQPVAMPSISGRALVGHVLEGSPGSWSGRPTSYAYRWEDCNRVGESCSQLAGATSSTYTLGSSEVGHTVRLLVTASNTAGSTEAPSAVSEVVNTESPATPPANTAPPQVSGTAQEGQTLTASEGSWSGSPTSYAYQWEDCNALGEACAEVAGATSSGYELALADVGHTLRVAVTATNASGSTKATSAPTATVLPLGPVNTGAPKVSGTAKEGQTLTASEGSWLGSPTSYAYQWEDCNGSGEACAEVGGATASSYKLAAGDVGHTMRVVVTASNAGGSTKASSEPSSAVVAATTPPPVNTALPKISGTAKEGQTLSASEGSWSGSPTSYAYQWEDCNSSGAACSEIGGARTSSYKLLASDVGHTVRVVVTATNAGGSTEAASAASAKVTPLAPANTALPKISGTAEEGQTLKASEGSWSGSPTSYAYQWEDCNSSGAACSEIGGATSSGYKLLASDVGHTMRVVVTATNAGGSTKASSEPSAAVAADAPAAPVSTGLPKVSGVAEEGQTLKASEGSWSGSPTSYAYQWEDCNSSGGACSEIGGATSSSYKLAAGDVGHTMRVVVTATNAGGSTKASSEPSAVVVAVSGSGPQVFVGEVGVGGESGDGCGSARSLAWLDSASSWGGGAGEVGPGVTVDLCGTLTGAVVVHGSGESGRPITLRFEPSAKISVPVCPESGCIDTNEQRFLDIEGAGESDRGVIESTDTGTGRKEGSAAERARGIEALRCEGCTIRYMDIEKLYEKTSEADGTVAEPIRGIEFSGSGLSIVHNTINYAGWALFSDWGATDKDVHIEYNTLDHIGHGFASETYVTGSSDIGPIVFAHNRLLGFKAWDTDGDPNHQDGVHCYDSGSSTAIPHYNGLFIYDNRFGPETGKYMNSSMYMEGSTGPNCGDASSNIWVFNNVSVMTEHDANGAIYDGTGQEHIYNNTFIGPNSSEPYPCVVISNDAVETHFKNNITTTCNEGVSLKMSMMASGGLDYNLYANGGDNFFNSTGEEGGSCHDFPMSEFAKWQSCTGQEQQSKAESSAGLKTSPGEQAGELEAGSPAKAAGANLTSLCETGEPTEELCKNINGEARPTTGAWNIGAY